MRMFWIIYSGAHLQKVTDAIMACGATGYTEFPHAHGAGTHGRIAGTRAWPGEETVVTSVVPSECAPKVTDGLSALQSALLPGERLHYAVLPVEEFR